LWGLDLGSSRSTGSVERWTLRAAVDDRNTAPEGATHACSRHRSFKYPRRRAIGPASRTMRTAAQNILYHATTVSNFCTFCCVKMHRKIINFATTILLRSLWICTVTVAGKLHRNFFCFDATLVQKICSDVSCEISDKITSPEKKLLQCFNSTKNCTDVSGEIHVGTVFFTSNRFLLHWCIYRSKSGACFASFIQFFCYNEPFSAALVRL
jgi:hypothetical protein